MSQIVKKVTNDEQVSFPFFIAFNTILANVELAKKVYLLATKGIRDREISIQEFQAASNMMSQITPLQSQILFTLSTLIHDSPTMIYSDFEKLAPEQYYRKVQKRIVRTDTKQFHARRVSLPEIILSMLSINRLTSKQSRILRIEMHS